MQIEIHKIKEKSLLQLTFIESGIPAGFPSPADDFLQQKLSLDDLLIKDKEATYFARVKGDSMIGAGLSDQDLLIIDKSVEPRDNTIAICYVDGEFTVKRLKIEKECVYLMPENSKYKPIKITDDNQLIIWGVVSYVIKKM